MNAKLNQILLCAAVACVTNLAASPAVEIFYGLAKSSPYTDHLPVFKRLFDQVKINGMIEFGLGLGTQYFVCRCPKVISVEILDSEQSDEWFYSCIEFTGNRPGWRPVLYRGSPALTWANKTAKSGQSPSQIDSSYLQELRDVVRDTLEEGVELAFVDAGIHNRSDLVTLLFGKVDVICAHDTNGGGNVYGWNWIATPADYEKVVTRGGQGVTFWVKKNRTDVLRAIRF